MPRLKEHKTSAYDSWRKVVNVIIRGNIALQGIKSADMKQTIGLNYLTLNRRLDKPEEFRDYEWAVIRKSLSFTDVESSLLDSLRDAAITEIERTGRVLRGNEK